MATSANTPPSRGGGFSLNSLRLPIIALGIFGILVGLAVWLVEGRFDWGARIPLALGILLIGIYVALDPGDVWGNLTGRSAIYTGNALVIGIAAIAILGLVNVLANRYQAKVDLTEERQFTLSDQSILVAQGLTQPVHVTGFFDATDSRRQDFQSRLEDFASRSGGLITYELIDPEQRPGEAAAAGVTQFGTVIYQMGDKRQQSTGVSESNITTALIKLTRAEKVVYFTIGHGERSIEVAEQGGYSQISRALETDNFRVEPLNLVTQRQVPDDAAVLVVAGPSNPFLPEEMDAIRAYLDNGGNLFLLVDPQSEADFNGLLERWNVQVAGNFVFDPGQSMPGDPRVPVVAAYPDHVITRGLAAFSLFPATTHFDVGEAGGSVQVTRLAETSPQSWGETSTEEFQQGPEDPSGPLTVALAVEDSASAGAPESGGPTPRLVLAGTSNLVSNQVLGFQVGNQELFMNAANWLAEEDDLIAERPQDFETRTMALTNTQANLLVYASFLFLPLAVLAAGVAVWWTRR